MTFRRLSPVFPVRSIAEAIEHYRKLGFTVRRYEGAGELDEPVASRSRYASQFRTFTVRFASQNT